MALVFNIYFYSIQVHFLTHFLLCYIRQVPLLQLIVLKYMDSVGGECLRNTSTADVEKPAVSKKKKRWMSFDHAMMTE